MNSIMSKEACCLAFLLGYCMVGAVRPATATGYDESLHIGTRLELFADRLLIDRMEGTSLKLHTPQDAGQAFAFDQPWEGGFSA